MATTTPNYGWPVPTSTDYVKDGATAIEALGDAIDATVFGLGASGFTLIKTQVIGSAVTSVTVTNAFNSTYDNYRIIVTGGVCNTTANMTMRLGASTTAYYMGRLNIAFAGGTLSGNGHQNAAEWAYAGAGDATNITVCADIFEPNKAVVTRISCVAAGASITSGAGAYTNGYHNVATAYTDFTLANFTGGTANMTGGTIYVYGYKK
jgi:hypothetical protein